MRSAGALSHRMACLAAAFPFGIASAQPPSVRVVNASAPPGGDGLTWTTAFNDLQPALDAQSGQPSITEIWVAAGVYTPTHATTSDPHSATFTLHNNLGIYGGFAGGEQALAERDPIAHITTLRGGNTPVGPANVYHVVTATGVDATAVLDGFTITGGRAIRETIPGPDSDLHGGGIFADSGSPTLSQLVITGNTAAHGGGAYIIGNASLSDTRVVSNGAANAYVYPGQYTSGRGGGLLLSGSPMLVRLVITGNRANSGGGAYITGTAILATCQITMNGSYGSQFPLQGAGVFLSGGPTLTDCEISRNTFGANTLGGGVYGSGTFIRCTISSNNAEDGFAIYGGGTFTDCQISGNNDGGVGIPIRFTQGGGLLRCTVSGNASGIGNGCIAGGSYRFCTLSNNHAYSTGPLAAGASFFNCLVSGNSNSGSITEFSGCSFTSCTLYGNSGGPQPIVSGSLINCIVWNSFSSAAQPYGTNVSYCNIQGWTGGGVGNSSADPLFVNPAAGDYHLRSTSPCIDSGDNSAILLGTFCDLDNHARFFDAPAPDSGNGTAPIVDRGAYEFGAPACCYANCDGSVSPPVLNVSDFVCFLNRFAARHPTADCDASGTFNAADFNCFLNAFAAGCP